MEAERRSQPNWSVLFDKKFCDGLRDHNYAHLDLEGEDREWAAALAREAQALHINGGFLPHRFSFGSQGIITKPHIFEADMHDSRLSLFEDTIVLFRAFFQSGDLAGTLGSIMPDLGLRVDSHGVSVKIQKNEGFGGCFPLHYDNPGPPNQRAVTVLVYLNEGWKQGDGGELLLQPFLGDPIQITPILGRVVAFRSDRMLHRVLPSHQERLCFTVWIDGEKVNSSEDTQLKAKHLADGVASSLLPSSPLQRSISRAVYASEYEDSLIESMVPTDRSRRTEEVVFSARALMSEHRAHVNALRSNQALAHVIDSLILLKPRSNTKVSDALPRASPAANMGELIS